jgi:hypothetical protein
MGFRCFGLLLVICVACDGDTSSSNATQAPNVQDTADISAVPTDAAAGDVDDTTASEATTAADSGTLPDTTTVVNRTNLVAVDQWVEADPDTDPFSGDRPDDLDCPEDAWGNEAGVLEIKTESCAYVTVSQPLMADVVAGDTLEITAWHGQLASFDVAMGTIAVAIGDDVVWREDIPIPNPGGFFVVPLEAPQDAPGGTLVRFHVHNHGFNSWNLASLQKLESSD